MHKTNKLLHRGFSSLLNIRLGFRATKNVKNRCFGDYGMKNKVHMNEYNNRDIAVVVVLIMQLSDETPIDTQCKFHLTETLELAQVLISFKGVLNKYKHLEDRIHQCECKPSFL